MGMGCRIFLRTWVCLLVLSSVFMMLFIGHTTIRSEAYADIFAQANRSTRHYLPQGANFNGSAIEKVVHYKDVRGVGNMGIGNGSLRTLASDVTLDPAQFMLPIKYMAANIQMDGASPSMVIGEPQKDIFREFPLEAGTMYGKLLGLRVPGGNTMDMGVRTIGYGYYDPNIVGEKIAAVSKLLTSMKSNAST